MSITRVGTQTASATTLTVPTTQAGDIVIMGAMHSGAVTAVTVPAGWISPVAKTNATATALSGRLAYRYATGSFASASQNTGTGVFTTAANNLAVNQAVQLTGSIPGGFAANTTYFVSRRT